MKHSLALFFLRNLAKTLNLLGFEIPPVVAVCAIIKNNKKILAIDLSYRKGLALPGGKLELEETLEEGLTREIKEETGCEVKSLKYFKSRSMPKGNLVGLTVCFEAKLKSYKLKSSNEGEPVWVTPEEFIKNAAYVDNKHFVKNYFSMN